MIERAALLVLLAMIPLRAVLAEMHSFESPRILRDLDTPPTAQPATTFLIVAVIAAVFTILTTYVDPTAGPKPLGLAAPLVVMAVPLYDTASVILARWRAGDPIWRGDRRHFSHRLVRRGMGVRRAVLLIWLATLTTAMPALLLPTAGWALAVGVLVQTLLVVALVALMESAGAHGRTTG